MAQYTCFISSMLALAVALLAAGCGPTPSGDLEPSPTPEGTPEVSPPPAGEVVSPVLEQPYSRQANLGWSHQLDESTVVSADYVRAGLAGEAAGEPTELGSQRLDLGGEPVDEDHGGVHRLAACG